MGKITNSSRSDFNDSNFSSSRHFLSSLCLSCIWNHKQCHSLTQVESGRCYTFNWEISANLRSLLSVIWIHLLSMSDRVLVRLSKKCFSDSWKTRKRYKNLTRVEENIKLPWGPHHVPPACPYPSVQRSARDQVWFPAKNRNVDIF